MVLEKNLLDVYGVDAVYHMTHIDNVVSILEQGLLSHANGLTKKDISNRDVNARRAIREPIYGKSIHDYVPFYFNPKNAMLYCRKDIQQEIVLFAFDRALIEEEGALFTNGNAASGDTEFFSNLSDLSKLSWKCLNAFSWNTYPDGKRVRMAEVLVPRVVSMKRLNKIICNSLSTYMRLKSLVGNKVEIELNSKFYF